MLKKKKIVFISVFLILIIFAITTCLWYVNVRIPRNQKGILLSFDDLSTESWEDTFALFEKYDVNVTFFVNDYPFEFCEKAIAAGHEIGSHTIGHERLDECTEEEIYEQAIAPLETFRENGINITSFAYPYGAGTAETDALLLQYYSTLRGAYSFEARFKEDMTNYCIDAQPMDHYYYDTDEQFQAAMNAHFDNLEQCLPGTVACFYSHAIAECPWGISAERLEWFIQEAQRRGFEFYTFNEFQ